MKNRTFRIGLIRFSRVGLITSLAVGSLISQRANAQWISTTPANDIRNNNTGSIQMTNMLNQGSFNPSGTPLQNGSATLANVNANFGGLILHSTQNDTSHINTFWGQNFDFHTPTDIRYRINGAVALQQFLDGKIYFYTGAKGTQNAQISSFGNAPKVGISNGGGMAIGHPYAINNNNGAGWLTVQERVGIKTPSPAAVLHVDASGQSATTGIRFAGLLSSNDQRVLTVDAAGNVHTGSLSGGGSGCASPDFLVKSASTTGTTTCSRIFDNGISVGIGVSSGFSYSWSGGLTGPTLPPTSGNLGLAVNGVTRALAYFATSDQKYKTNIANIANPFDLINNLTGRTYNWNDSAREMHGADSSRQYGVIAQEVASVMPEAVIVDENGDYAVNYNAFIPLLLEGEKELYNQLSGARASNQQLQETLNNALTELQRLRGEQTNVTAPANRVKQNELYQNVPNPFNVETKIAFTIAESSQTGFIGIYDMNGKQLMKIGLDKSKSFVTIPAKGLTPGLYYYSLIVNDQLVDTKKMVVVE